MRICFFTTDYVLPVKGGVERVVYNLTNMFQQCGHDVLLLSSTKAHESVSLPFKHQYSLIDCNHIASDENINQLKKISSQFKIDVIINASHQADMFELAYYFKQINQCKLISTLYCTPDAIIKGLPDDVAKLKFYETNIVKRTIKAIALTLLYPYRKMIRLDYLKKKYNKQYNLSDAFILESESYKQLFLDIIGETDNSKLFAIPNPLSKCESVTQNSERKKQILFISRMNIEQKRPDRMIKIWKGLFKEFPDWELLMIGDGQAKSALMNYVQNNNIRNVRFLPTSDLHDYYRNAEILCMTSSYEGFGLVLVEAQQHGVIPVAFDSYFAIHDIIHDKFNGVLITPFSISSYQKALTMLMRSSELRHQYRINLQKNDFSKFSQNTVISIWQSLIANV